jgi:hypothetical protein
MPTEAAPPVAAPRVVLCSDQATQPVVNTGTIYQ